LGSNRRGQHQTRIRALFAEATNPSGGVVPTTNDSTRGFASQTGDRPLFDYINQYLLKTYLKMEGLSIRGVIFNVK